ncbi:succinyl-diaminopimelate desuccinylase [Gallaecimonas sp. GXIMD4217]|uniref:succinyl-diaminopimelate desuccinylase n=1 Tax=Gallaecimonas sp. GXIMD4217 TaxID=3131927 RepID=UPI00311AD934
MSVALHHSPSPASLVRAHLEALLDRASVTPNDAGCQDYLAAELGRLGFAIERFQCEGVSNLIARRPGQGRLAFSGHTDVVPAGRGWRHEPFALTEAEGHYIGRGIADMKGGIAAFLAATELALGDGHRLPGLMVLLTSDEEGEAEHGSRLIAERLAGRGELPPWVLIGEPTARERSGDTLRVGRRGAISGALTLTGRAGHVAYQPGRDNVLHQAMVLGQRLAALEWDGGCSDFPGTGFHLTGLEHGDWVDNVTPSKVTLRFNLRYSHRYSHGRIDERIRALADALGWPYELDWSRPCEPYLSQFSATQPNFLTLVERASFAELQRFPVLSTAGGASDGRFFAAAGCEVIELGLPNGSIHQANERVPVAEMDRLVAIYRRLLASL